MATATPTQPSPTDSSRSSLVHNVSLGAVIICPIIMLIPPRKLDAYTLALLSGMAIGGNQLSIEYTGQSIPGRFASRMKSASASITNPLPPKAMEMQARLKAEKEKRDMLQNGALSRVGAEAKESGVLQELEAQKTAREKKEKGLIEKVWLGGEGDDWKAKRDQREKEALEDGRGYGGLIMDQIWEVWSWGKNKNEEVKEIDEKVVAEQKAKKEADSKK
jgi:hypothetical protein